MALIKNSVVNSGGNPIMLQGLDSEIPQAAVVGRLFVATNTLIIYRDNGSTWDVVGGGGGSQNLQNVTDLGNYTSNIIVVNDGNGFNSNVASNAIYVIDENFTSRCQLNFDSIRADNFNNGKYVGMTYNGLVDESLDSSKVFNCFGERTVLISGSYTPTLIPSSNCASVTLIYANWLRIGNIVTVSILMNVTPNIAGLNTGVQAITLPVSFSTYNRYQARGVVYDTLTQSVVSVSGFNSGSSSTTIFFTPVTNNVQSVSIEIIYSGTP